jgi:hypothetical protein
MLALLTFFCLWAAEPDAGAPIEATLLAGGPISMDRSGPLRGGLLQISESEMVLAEKDGPRRTAPLEQVLSIDFLNRRPRPPGSAIRVATTDGSRLLCRSYDNDGKRATLRTTSGLEATIDARAVLGVLLKDLPAADSARWLARAIERRSADVLTVDKEGQKADLEGILGAAGPAGVQFTLDGETVQVKRDRIESMLYAHEFQPREGRADVVDSSGNFWTAASLQYAFGMLLLRTPSGIEVRLPAADVVRINFARGRLTFLSDLEPTVVEHTPYFDRPWEYRRDQNLDRRPIRVHGVEYAKGLVVHSRTQLEYAIDGKHRRFESLVGVEDSAGDGGDAEARVVGDGKVLWQGRVRAGAPPLSASCSIEGVRSLRLEVDYGENLDLGDHVAWAEARLVK